jgi:hypothetical protein
VRFCYISRGSLEETISHIVFAYKVDYVSETLYQNIATEGESLNRLINGYIAFLKKSKQGANEPGAHYAARELPANYILEESTLISDSIIE